MGWESATSIAESVSSAICEAIPAGKAREKVLFVLFRSLEERGADCLLEVCQQGFRRVATLSTGFEAGMFGYHGEPPWWISEAGLADKWKKERQRGLAERKRMDPEEKPALKACLEDFDDV